MKAKKPFKLRSLNSKGVSHLLVPLLVVVTLAVGGTFMLVSSHANNSGVLGQQTTNTGGTEAKTGSTKKPKKSKIDPNTSKLVVFSASGTYKSFKVLSGPSAEKATAAKCGVSPLAGKDKTISKTPKLTKSSFNLSEKFKANGDKKNYYEGLVICKDPAQGESLYVVYSTNKAKKSKFTGKPLELGSARTKSCILVHPKTGASANTYKFAEGKCTITEVFEKGFIKPASLPSEPDDPVNPDANEQ